MFFKKGGRAIKTDRRNPNIRSGLDELNLAEYPIAFLTDKTTISKGKKTIRVVEKSTDENGKPTERRWTVTGSDEYGLPVSPDDEVLMCLLEITKEKTNFETRNVPITCYDIIKRMGWNDEGKNYQRVKDALARLKAVSITAENVFWNNNTKRYTTAGFGIIDDYFIEKPVRGHRSDGQQELHFSYIAWNQVLFQSFKNGNLKSIDLALWRYWKHPITRRLHRYLDKHFHWTSRIQVSLSRLASLIPLPESKIKYPSTMKQEINKAAQEMLNAGYIREFRYIREDGDEMAVFIRRENDGKQLETSTPQDNTLLQRLVAASITRAKAERLLKNADRDFISNWMDHLPFVTKVQDPAAYLVSAIEGQWQIPARARKAKQRHDEEQQKQKELERLQNLSPEGLVENRLNVWSLTFPFHNNRQPTAEEIEKKRSELHEFYKKDKSDEDKPCAR